MITDASEKKIERMQFEYVFGLTGGELEDKAWSIDGHDFAYWYEGVPDWMGREKCKDRYDSGISYRTIVFWNSCPPRLEDSDGTIWVRCQYGMASGETECPGHGQIVGDEEESLRAQGTTGPCPLCESPVGEEHGMIYVGDGFGEAVYRRENHAAYLSRVVHEVFDGAVEVTEIDDEVVEIDGVVYLSVSVEGTKTPLYSWGHVVSYPGGLEEPPSVDYNEAGCVAERGRAIEGLCGLFARARLAMFTDKEALELEEES